MASIVSLQNEPHMAVALSALGPSLLAFLDAPSMLKVALASCCFHSAAIDEQNWRCLCLALWSDKQGVGEQQWCTYTRVQDTGFEEQISQAAPGMNFELPGCMHPSMCALSWRQSFAASMQDSRRSTITERDLTSALWKMEISRDSFLRQPDKLLLARFGPSNGPLDPERVTQPAAHIDSLGFGPRRSTTWSVVAEGAEVLIDGLGMTHPVVRTADWGWLLNFNQHGVALRSLPCLPHQLQQAASDCYHRGQYQTAKALFRLALLQLKRLCERVSQQDPFVKSTPEGFEAGFAMYVGVAQSYSSWEEETQEDQTWSAIIESMPRDRFPWRYDACRMLVQLLSSQAECFLASYARYRLGEFYYAHRAMTEKCSLALRIDPEHAKSKRRMQRLIELHNSRTTIGQPPAQLSDITDEEVESDISSSSSSS